MSDKVVLQFSAEGLKQLDATLAKVTGRLDALDNKSQLAGISTGLEKTVQAMVRQQSQIDQLTRAVSQSVATMNAVVNNSLAQTEAATTRSAGRVASATKKTADSMNDLHRVAAKFGDVRKNFRFDEVTRALNAVQSGAKLSTSEFNKSKKTLNEFSYLLKNMKFDKEFIEVFSSTFGSNPARFVAKSGQLDTALKSLASHEKGLNKTQLAMEKMKHEFQSIQGSQKNFRFKTITDDLKALESGTALTTSRLNRLKQTMADFKKLAPDLAGNGANQEAFTKMYGKSAMNFAKAGRFEDANKSIAVYERGLLRAATAQETLNRSLGRMGASRLDNQFNEFNNALNALRNGSKLAENDVGRLAKRMQEYIPLAKQLQSGAINDEAITKKHGPEALRYLKSGTLQGDSNLVSTHQAAIATEREAKSILSLNSAYDRQVQHLRAVSKGHIDATATSKAYVNSLNEVMKRYATINAMPAGVAKEASMTRFLAGTSPQLVNDIKSGELAKTVEGGLQRLRSSANETKTTFHQMWRGITSATGNIWLSWSSALGPMLAGFATTAAVVKSISLNKNFAWELQMVGVAAEAGDKTIQGLRDSVMELSNTGMVQGPMQMAQALRVLAQAGLGAEDSFKALKATLDLALVGNVSDGQAAQYLAGLKSAFDLTDASGALDEKLFRNAADVTAKAAEVSQTSVEAIMESMKQAAPEAVKFNVSIAETSTLISQLAKVNITGSSAGTAIKNLLTDLSGRTPKAQKALDDLGVSMFNAQGMTRPILDVLDDLRNALDGMNDEDKSHWMRRIFNERGMRAANVLMNETSENLRHMFAQVDRANENLGYSGVQSERLANTAEGMSRRFGSAWEGAFIRVGAASEENFKSALQSGIDLANNPQLVAAITGLVNVITTTGATMADVAQIVLEFTPLIAGLGTVFAVNLTASLVGSIANTKIFSSAIAATVAPITAARASLIGLTTAGTASNTAMIASATSARASAVSMAALMTSTSGVGAAMGAASVATRGATAAVGALATAGRALSASFGWVGILALALGGLVTVLTNTRAQTDLLKSSMDGLPATIGSVDADFLEQFNKSGAGRQLDLQLGVGVNAEYAKKMGQAIVNDESLFLSQRKDNYTDFSNEVQKINTVFAQHEKTQMTDVYNFAKTLSQNELQNQLMIADRKNTFLREELSEYDKFMQGKNELSAGEIAVRIDIEKQITDNYERVLGYRLELAKRNLQEIEAENRQSASIISNVWKYISDGTYQATVDAQRHALNNDPAKKAAYDRAIMGGDTPEMATARVVGRTMTNEQFQPHLDAYNRGQYAINTQQIAQTVGGLAQLEETLKTLQNSKGELTRGSWSDPFTGSTEAASRRVAITEMEKYLTAAIASGRARMEELEKSGLAPHQAKPVTVDGTVDSPEKFIKTVVSKPYYSEAGKISEEILKHQKSYLDYLIETQKQQKGYADKDLVQKRAAMETAMRSADFEKTAESYRKQATEIRRKLATEEELSAEERAGATQDLGRIEGLIRSMSPKGKVDLGFDFKKAGDGALVVSVNNLPKATDRPKVGAFPVSSGFGVQRSGYKHGGIDLAAPVGTGVYSAKAGTVSRVENHKDGYGKVVYVQNNDSTTSIYGHLSEQLVKVGDKIEQGMRLALSGNTGRSSGPHLHYEERNAANAKLDPSRTLASVGVLGTGGPLSGPNMIDTKGMGVNKYNHSAVSGENAEDGALYAQEASMSKVLQTRMEIKGVAEQELATTQRVNNELLRQTAIGNQYMQDFYVVSDLERQRMDNAYEMSRIETEHSEKLLELQARTGETAGYEFTQQELITEELRKQAMYKGQKIEKDHSWQGGWDSAVKKVKDEADNLAKPMEAGFTSVVDNMSNAFEQFVITGKMSFRDLTVSILSDIAKIAARQAIIQGMTMLFGGAAKGAVAPAANTSGSAIDNLFARGGAFGGGGVRAFANGGMVAHHPRTFAMAKGVGLLGEAGAEGIFPLSRMANGDLGIQVAGAAAGGGGGVVVSNNIYVTVSNGETSSETDTQGNTDSAIKLGEIIAAKATEIVMHATQDGGIIAQQFMKK